MKMMETKLEATVAVTTRRVYHVVQTYVWYDGTNRTGTPLNKRDAFVPTKHERGHNAKGDTSI